MQIKQELQGNTSGLSVDGQQSFHMTAIIISFLQNLPHCWDNHCAFKHSSTDGDSERSPKEQRKTWNWETYVENILWRIIAYSLQTTRNTGWSQRTWTSSYELLNATWVRFVPAAQGCAKVHTIGTGTLNTTAITLPQGFSFQRITEASSQPCWQTLSCGGEESINFAVPQAKLCLQPLDGCIPNSCQLLLIMLTITWDLHNLSYLLHVLHFPALPNSQQGTFQIAQETHPVLLQRLNP